MDMDKNNKVNRLAIIGEVLLFAIIIYIRFSWFDEHFTHYDDIKVAQLTNYSIDVFQMNFSHWVDGGTLSKEMYNLLYLLLSKPYNWIIYAINFSKYWHYAPGQFFFTFALLPYAYDYDSIKFFGRFPSLILGIFALLLCWKVIRKCTDSNAIAFFGTAMLGFSWQAIIYCMSMGNYESIIFLGFLTCLLLMFTLKNDHLKKWILLAISVGIMSWFQYQALCLFGGIAFVFLCRYLKQKIKLKYLFINTTVLCISYAVVVLPLLSFACMDGSPTWNAGPNGEYLFHPTFNIVYIIKFFLYNSGKIFKTMLSPVPLGEKSANLIACFYVILFLIGLIFSIFKESENEFAHYLSIFSCGVIFVQYFFVLLGKFTLSPTRHSNILIPMFILECSLGMYYMTNKIKNLHIKKFLPLILGICIGINWFNYSGEVKKERTDLFTVQTIESIISKYNPDMVIDCTAPQLWYLLGQEYSRREIIDYQTDFYDLDDDSYNNKTILIVSHVNEINQEILNYCKNELVDRNYLSAIDVEKLLTTSPFEHYENRGEADFDFYNVTNGACNGMFYSVFKLE